MLKKHYLMVLYIQILLIVLSVLSYVAYLQALQTSSLLAQIFMVLGFSSGIVAFVLVFFAFDLAFNKKPNKLQENN